MAAKPKTEVFLFRMDETERRMLDELTEKTGLNGAELLRQLLRREYGAVIGEAPGAKRPKPKR